MGKVTKNARIADLESKLAVMQAQIDSLIECGHNHTRRLIALEPDNPFHGKLFEPEPKLKVLDQSVFDGLDEKWRFAAVVADDRALYFDKRPYDSDDTTGHFVFTGDYEASFCGTGYDTSNWQNSLIERDLAKELLEVDLSSELTGSDLCRAMLERGDKAVLCKAYDHEENDFYYDAITSCSDVYFDSCLTSWSYAIPINNQGEPLTQSDVGL